MTMVERVARALAREHFLIDEDARPGEADYDAWLTSKVAGAWLHWKGAARAAIEAMREPGSALMKAGATRSAMEGPPEFQKLNAAAVWQAMITAALSEGEG